MSFLLHIFTPWCWRMAWRDSRRARARLLFFSLSIMAGIAALVTIGSLRDSLLQALDNEARALLGADLYCHAKKPFSPKAEELLTATGAIIQRESAYTTMARSGENVRLVQARAVDPRFPFFGKPETQPPDAWARCLSGEGFVADPALAEHLAIQPGSRIKIGELELPLLGTLIKPPPQVSMMTAFAPEMFFARALAPQTKLDGPLGFNWHRAWLLFPDGTNVDRIVDRTLKNPLRAEGINTETVNARKRTAAQVLERVYSFLSLTAFIALVLGGLGIASAIHVHVSGRLPVVATLRCMGCTPARALAVYVLQGMWLGLAGATGGVLIGTAAVAAAPAVLRSILPVEIQTRVPAGIVIQSLIFGFVLCLSFSLLPLLKVRRVSPAAAVRAHISGGGRWWRDPLAWLALPLAAGALIWLSVLLSPADNPRVGPLFCAALGVALLLLAAVARLIMWSARKTVRPWWPFTLRQGLAGLHRPRNQTMLFLLSVGTAVSLVLTTLITESLLTTWLRSGQTGIQENFFVLDLKPEQRAPARATLESGGAKVTTEAPVTRVSLRSLKGQSVEDMSEKKRGQRPSGWALTHVYRASWDPDAPLVMPETEHRLSLEKSLAENLKLKPGDSLTLDAAGTTLQCTVAELHEISWERLFSNFPIIFRSGQPAGIPSSWATGAQITDAVMGARLQKQLSTQLPGTTIFDIAAMTAVIGDMIERGSWLIHSLSLLTVFTGLIILAAVLLAGRRDRVEESVLLRTLGASRRQIRRILIWEYLLLGLFASATGALLSLGAGWLLATGVFKVPYTAWHWPLAAAIALVCGTTALLGMALSRGVARHPPLTILRAEG
jgi:putative ABC transport system permease protein